MNARFSVFGLLLALALLLPATAQAHRLNVYAWLDNDKIIVDCNFGQNHPAKEAAVAVLDSMTRQTLLNGKTDERGQFSFTVPSVIRQGHGLIIDVNAGQGHHNVWSMDAAELYAAASLTAGFDKAAVAQQQNEQRELRTRPVPPVGLAMPEGPVTQEQIRQIVKECLEAQLAPLRQELAASTITEPTIVEIIGGLGWIMGLVGIALYFKSRKNA